MNGLTDGSSKLNLTDQELAFWLVNDAMKLEGVPGMNNVMDSIRQAAFRLDPSATPWLTKKGNDHE